MEPQGADLACLGAERASSLALRLLFIALLGVAIAWRTRAQVAAAEQQKAWSAVMLLLGFLHGFACFVLVPTGCAEEANFVAVFGSMLPWGLSAALFRLAVAPPPPSLSVEPLDEQWRER